MTKEQQEKHFDALVGQMREILLKKGNDYANIDRLSNFKLAGSISGLNAELNCLSLISTKVARLGVLLNSKNKPNNESIQDSVLDLANYSILLSMILSERDEVLPNLQDATIGKSEPKEVVYYTFDVLKELCEAGGTEIKGNFVLSNPKLASDLLKEHGYFSDYLTITSLGKKNRFLIETKKM